VNSRNVLVLAPNGGYSLDYGGGAFTTVAIANSLVNLGFRVCLLALNSIGRAELSRVHGVSVHDSVNTIFLNEVYAHRIRFPPYIGARVLSQAVRDIVRRNNIGTVVFGDDAPRGLPLWLREKRVLGLLYCHFSYFMRSLNARIASFSYNDSARLVPSMLYWRIVFNSLSDFDGVLCNSTVTQRFVEAFFPGIETCVLNPPALMASRVLKKEPWLVHTAQLGRPMRYDLAYDAISELGRRIPQARFITTRCDTLPPKVRKRLAALRNVILLGSLSKKGYEGLMARSSMFVSFRWFEPFGISTVEAMAHGTVPMIYRSSLSGSWTDVLDCGRYGKSFANASELVGEAESLMTDTDEMLRVARECTARASHFSFDQFQRRLADVMARFQ